MTNLERIAKLGQMIWVIKPSQFRMDELRNAMTFKRRLEFRSSIEGHELYHFSYDIHHIIPICYGGSNKFSNLCLVPKETHALIHYYIDSMNKPMKPFQRGYVWVPMIPKKIYSL